MVEEKDSIDTTTYKMPEGQRISHSHLGPVLGVLLLLLVVVAAGLYLWGAELQKDVANQEAPRDIINNEPETPRAEADIQILETLSTSNEIGAIEADIMSTNLDTLDADIAAVEQEMRTAIEP